MLTLTRLRTLMLGLLTACTMLPIDNATAAETPKELNFGVISTESTSALKNEWQPFFADMERAIGIKVNGFFATDYAGIVEGMRFNKVQVAWYGNASAVQAVDRSDGEVFAQKIYPDGSKGYYSLLITHRDSPIKTIDEVLKAPGKWTFGNGDPNSTSGFLVPGYYLWARNDIDVRKHFTRMVSGSHEVNMMAVANKQVDVATNNTDDMEKIRRNHPDKVALVRELWRSPIIPADPIVWRKDLDDATKAKLKAFIFEYGTDKAGADQERQQKVLAGLHVKQFVPSSDAQLYPVRQIALFKDRVKVEGDDTMTPADRQAKLQELDHKLKELDQKMRASAVN